MRFSVLFSAYLIEQRGDFFNGCLSQLRGSWPLAGGPSVASWGGAAGDQPAAEPAKTSDSIGQAESIATPHATILCYDTSIDSNRPSTYRRSSTYRAEIREFLPARDGCNKLRGRESFGHTYPPRTGYVSRPAGQAIKTGSMSCRTNAKCKRHPTSKAAEQDEYERVVAQYAAPERHRAPRKMRNFAELPARGSPSVARMS